MLMQMDPTAVVSRNIFDNNPLPYLECRSRFQTAPPLHRAPPLSAPPLANRLPISPFPCACQCVGPLF
jgi:hypothetical protein